MQPKRLNVDPSLLRPNPWNTNHVSPENEVKLGNSLEELGLFRTFLVREVPGVPGYELLGGEHRWRLTMDAKMKTVPIDNFGVISDDHAKKIGLADNSRYGVDNSIDLAKLLKDLGSPEELQTFLPYTDHDLTSIFSSVDIALDQLDLDADESESEIAAEEPKITPPPKTHTVMRFQVPLGDSEKIADLIARTTKRQGFTHGSDLQNAGDALVLLLIGSSPAPAADEFPDGLDASAA